MLKKREKMSLKVPKCINSDVLLAGLQPDLTPVSTMPQLRTLFYCVSSVTRVTRQDNN